MKTAVGCFGMGQGVSPLLTTPTRYHVEDSWYIKGPPLSPQQGPDPAKNLPAPMCCCGMKFDSQNIWLALFITESVICCSVLDIAGFDACVWPQPATVTSEPFKIEDREREVLLLWNYSTLPSLACGPGKQMAETYRSKKNGSDTRTTAMSFGYGGLGLYCSWR